MKNNIWKNGIMGVITGDALGCPVQFLSREQVARNPVTGMRGYGTFHLPAGSWTDDGSLTMAALVSILEKKCVDPEDIMDRFVRWLNDGEYTPFGESFDNGRATTESIFRYIRTHDVRTCGGRGASDNGNGSLMRIMPVCLYAFTMQRAGKMTDEEAVALIHCISGLTHNHLRAKIACGLYFFMVREILTDSTNTPKERTLAECLQAGLDAGFAFYEKDPAILEELRCYDRLRDLAAFENVPVSKIRGSGYVVAALEAAVWSLLQEDSFEDALLTAVNLGEDTDTVAAIAGGLAGLFYGYSQIPSKWLCVIQRRDWIESVCDETNAASENGFGA